MENQNSVITSLGLTARQTALLYNMQLAKTTDDISKEPDEKKRKLKKHWKNRWQFAMKNVYQSMCSENIEWIDGLDCELAKAIKNELQESANKTWLYLAIMETEFFIPYYPLDIRTEKGKNGKKKQVPSKEFASLKLQKKVNWLERFLTDEKIPVDSTYLPRIRKTYQKTLNRLLGRTTTKLLLVLIPLLVMAMFAAIAAVFAGPIAVALFGPAFAGLHGAALVSACLAYIGGGAIAIGGAGMAGGVVTIACGGALLGLAVGGTATGITMGARAMLSSPAFALTQAAKLEVALKEIFLNTQKDMRVAQEIIRQFKDRITAYEHEIVELRREEEENKELIKNMEKSIEYLKKALKEMERFRSAYETGAAHGN